MSVSLMINIRVVSYRESVPRPLITPVRCIDALRTIRIRYSVSSLKIIDTGQTTYRRKEFLVIFPWTHPDVYTILARLICPAASALSANVGRRIDSPVKESPKRTTCLIFPHAPVIKGRVNRAWSFRTMTASCSKSSCPPFVKCEEKAQTCRVELRQARQKTRGRSRKTVKACLYKVTG